MVKSKSCYIFLSRHNQTVCSAILQEQSHAHEIPLYSMNVVLVVSHSVV